MSLTAATQRVAVRFGARRTGCVQAAAGPVLNLNIPLLGGPSEESIGAGFSTAREESGFHLATGAGVIAGVASAGAEHPLEDIAFEIYRDLLRIVRGYSLYRVWNYIPAINEETGGLENYRRFNLGRWSAFRDSFGSEAIGRMPAASAVGCDGERLAVAFLAGRAAATYVENPEQIPAYHYPPDYGPKAPSFARGAVVEIGGRKVGYLSGTASIKGHRSVGHGDLRAQFETTLSNIRIVSNRMGYAGATDPGAKSAREFKAYVRRAEDGSKVAQWLAEAAGISPDAITVLRADICRAELDVEIEAVFGREQQTTDSQ